MEVCSHVCTTILWKSDSPVSITVVFWKNLGQFVDKRPMQDGVEGFL